MRPTSRAQQLDAMLNQSRSLPRRQPDGGWLRAIRQALRMTTRQLARAVGVTQGAVVDAERTEAKGDITLATLRRYAAALGCELTYTLIPKRPLQRTVEERAERVARECISRLMPPPGLEDEPLSRGELELAVAELRRKLLDAKRPRLWG
jgi:predicted DNA-binding mobile mystery protein A